MPTYIHNCISGFRTVSDEVVLVLAKTIAINILADEIRRIYFRRLEYPEQRAVKWENSLKEI